MAEIQSTRQQTVTVDGEGDTKQRAFASALTNIQTQLIDDQEETILRIEPTAVEPLSLVKESYVEKFLFFFFKRTRTTYKVRLNVTVTITAIALPALEFTDRQLPSPDAIRMPHLKWFTKGAK